MIIEESFLALIFLQLHFVRKTTESLQVLSKLKIQRWEQCFGLARQAESHHRRPSTVGKFLGCRRSACCTSAQVAMAGSAAGGRLQFLGCEASNTCQGEVLPKRR